MLIRSRPSWFLPENAATPEAAVLQPAQSHQGRGRDCGECRAFVLRFQNWRRPSKPDAPDPSAKLYPAKRNTHFTLDRAITQEQIVETYNNYYEFGTSKSIYNDAQALPIRPWSVSIEGMVEKPFTIAIDDLIKKMPLEERLYRHRCVETWAMAVPWTGFPMKALIDLAKPLSGTQFVEMQTFMKPDVASGQGPALVSMALYRRPHHGGGDERSRLSRHRRLWQAAAQADGRAAAFGDAVEIRIQIGQGDRALQIPEQPPAAPIGKPSGPMNTASGRM